MNDRVWSWKCKFEDVLRFDDIKWRRMGNGEKMNEMIWFIGFK